MSCLYYILLTLFDVTKNINACIVYCPISCDSCPEPIDLSKEEQDLLDAVAKYGKEQKVEVSCLVKKSRNIHLSRDILKYHSLIFLLGYLFLLIGA